MVWFVFFFWINQFVRLVLCTLCIIVSLQLGAGTSLPGLVAAKVGADVTLTDDANKLEVLNLGWCFLFTD